MNGSNGWVRFKTLFLNVSINFLNTGQTEELGSVKLSSHWWWVEWKQAEHCDLIMTRLQQCAHLSHDFPFHTYCVGAPAYWLLCKLSFDSIFFFNNLWNPYSQSARKKSVFDASHLLIVIRKINLRKLLPVQNISHTNQSKVFQIELNFWGDLQASGFLSSETAA